MKSLYLNRRLYGVLLAVACLFAAGFSEPVFLRFARLALVLCLVLFVVDIFLLYRTRRGLFARRETGERFSNGDENPVSVVIENHYAFNVRLEVIDELPVQFQIRDQVFQVSLDPGQVGGVRYRLRPTRRGEYEFGALNIYASSPIGLAKRRFRFEQAVTVPVYPSFLQMRKYELYAISNQLVELGIKKIRRVGHTMEFEHIREYVEGDDYRTINWRATARRRHIMVNQYQDERSQRVYCVVDMGRVMQLPFEGMSLLDYAINASLVLSNIALHRQDKAGIVTFSNRVHALLPAGRRTTQIKRILELLYNQTTDFKESDFEGLFATVRRAISQRSLLVLFTNFDTLSSMRRQLAYLRRLARHHLLVVVFFENTELNTLLHQPAQNTEQIYLKTIAEKFVFEKQQIVKELARYGIHAILTPPQNLTANAINKYLELKARGLS